MLLTSGNEYGALIESRDMLVEQWLTANGYPSSRPPTHAGEANHYEDLKQEAIESMERGHRENEWWVEPVFHAEVAEKGFWVWVPPGMVGHIRQYQHSVEEAQNASERGDFPAEDEATKTWSGLLTGELGDWLGEINLDRWLPRPDSPGGAGAPPAE
jgi:hypothetical protein